MTFDDKKAAEIVGAAKFSCPILLMPNGKTYNCLSNNPIRPGESAFFIVCMTINEDAYQTALADPNSKEVSILENKKFSPATQKILREQLLDLPTICWYSLLDTPFMSGDHSCLKDYLQPPQSEQIDIFSQACRETAKIIQTIIQEYQRGWEDQARSSEGR